MSLPPLKSTDLDKILTGDTSHPALLLYKISSRSENLKYQKLHLKIKIFKKSSFSWGHRHNMAGMYEPWAKIP